MCSRASASIVVRTILVAHNIACAQSLVCAILVAHNCGCARSILMRTIVVAHNCGCAQLWFVKLNLKVCEHIDIQV